MGMWTYEREQWKNGVQTVCGVDEAGAGPLMGAGVRGGGDPAERIGHPRPE